MEMLALLMLGGLLAAFAGLGGGGDDDNGEPDGGTPGDDSLEGAGNDTLRGFGGDDTLTLQDSATGAGDTGNDTIRAWDDASAYGGAGDDELGVSINAEGYGGAGDDTLLGSGWMDGGAGNDFLESSSSSGQLFGGLNDDTLFLSGTATATGGAGSDRFTLDIPSWFSHTTSPFPEVLVSDFIAGEDSVVITANGPINGITVREEDGDTIIEGLLDGGSQTYGAAIRLEGVTGFDLADLTVASDRPLPEETPFTAVFDQRGVGDDNVTLGADTWLDSGAGNDVITAGAGGHHVILTGDGDDNVTTGSYGRVLTGAGDDVIAADLPPPIAPGAEPPGLINPSQTWIEAGAGNDVVTITDSSPADASGTVWVDGGAGDDTITVDESVTGRISIGGNAGADTITMWSRANSSVNLWVNADQGDSLTLNVGGDQPLSGQGTWINPGTLPDHSIDIRIDAQLTGQSSWVPVSPDPNDPSYDCTSLRIGGVEVARFPGTEQDWATDPRITITRGVVF